MVEETGVPMVDDNAANDLGVEKEDMARMVAPIPAGMYDAIFMGLKKNEETKGFVLATAKGGKKVVASFSVQGTGDPVIDGRWLPPCHIAVGYKQFAQLDKALDLVTGKAIDPAKVEEAVRKMVRLKVTIDEEYNPDNPTNKIEGIYPFTEKKATV